MPSANDTLIPDLDSTPGTTPPTNPGLHPSTATTSGKKKKKNKKKDGSKQKPWDDTSEDTAYPKSVTPSPPVDHFSALRVTTEPTPPNSEPEPEALGAKDDDDQAMAAWEETPPQPPVELDLEPEPEVHITEPELLVEDYGEVATGQYQLEPEERPPSPKPPPAPSPVRNVMQPAIQSPPAPAPPIPAMKKPARSRGLDRDYDSSLSRPTSVAEKRRGDSTTQPTSPVPRKSFVEPANPPHMAQNHYFGVPGLDLGRGAAKPEKGAKQAGSEHYCCCFDSFSNAGDAASATKAKDALIVGWEGGLDVFRVLKDKMEIVGRLEGLRGSVVGAKIIPWSSENGDTTTPRPLVAVVIHGPSEQQAFDAEEPTRHYQTTVEVFSLHNQQHLSTLYRSLPVALPEAKLGQFATVPEPVGDLRLDTKGKYLTVSSGKSGEIFVFAQGRESASSGGFRCIGKYWTSLQSRFDVQARPNGSAENLPGNEAPEPQTSPLMSLSGRWLAFVPPSSSSRISVQGTLALSEDSQQPPGVGAHLAPPQPSVTCDIVGLNSEGVLAKFSRQAAQEILKASRRGIEMGMAGWREFTQPSPPSRTSQRADNGEEMMFPPTNAPDDGTKRVTKEPAVVAIVDLERLIDAEENNAKHLPPPLASFALEDGCNYLSLSADGLRLLTASRKGESSNIWDLRHAAHGSYHKRDVDEGDAVVGPHVTRIQSIVRSTQSVVLDAAWARDGNFVALLTAHGTVHLHEVSSRQESQKRRRKSTITAPVAEKADATVSLSTGLSPPSSNGFLGGIRSGWQTVSTQVNAMRSNTTTNANTESRGTFVGIPTTFAGFREVTNAGAAAGGRAIARGLSQGYSVARTGAADVWHADDNKIKHKDPLNNDAARSVRWLRSRSGMSVAVACGGKVHLYPVQRVSRPRGESTFSGLKAEWKGRREFPLPPIATTNAFTPPGKPSSSCAQQGPHGFWSLRAPVGFPASSRPNTHNLHSQASSESDKALYETNPPYCPLYIDRRVSMLGYADSSSSYDLEIHDFQTKGHGLDDADEQAWLFGERLPPATKLNERSAVSEASLSDDEDEDVYQQQLTSSRGGPTTFEADLAAADDAGVQSRIMINPKNNEIRIGSSRKKAGARKNRRAAAEELGVLEGDDEDDGREPIPPFSPTSPLTIPSSLIFLSSRRFKLQRRTSSSVRLANSHTYQNIPPSSHANFSRSLHTRHLDPLPISARSHQPQLSINYLFSSKRHLQLSTSLLSSNMAAEVSSMPVNGSYAPQQHFDQQQYAAQTYSHAAPASSTPASTASTQPEIPKDEVGWYFVEQYYTTLSRTPEKLYLYYNKRSQFVSGNETDKVQVCVGQRAINDRIKELDFQDCKVRITNVDSQASDVNIVIQVIGEISNRSQPHRKFTQTFVLAQQTNGYFVLNDIFRYMIEEEEEVAAAVESAKAEEVQQEPAAESGFQEPPPTVEDSEPKTLTSSADKAAVEQDAQAVDKELEEKVLKEQPKEEAKEEAAPAVNGTAEKKEEVPVEQPAAEAAAPEPALEQEKPRDPEPTPVSEQPPKVTKPAAPAAPVKPAVPKTWASLAASAASKVSMPAHPAATPAAAPAQQSTKPATAAKSAPTPAAAPAAQREASPATTNTAAAANSGDEWTAVGGSHNRQQSRQVNGQQQEPTHPRGYIRNVQENIKGPELKEKLSQFGEIGYFDIYRQKSCAFVDFKTPEGYKAAIAANPIQIGDEKFTIEERRAARGNNNGGNNNNNQQQQQFGGRGNYQQGGNRGARGNFRGNNRGGAGGARGGNRGAQAQAQ
ncbi:hypothetical protein Q7P37_008680 [Cladosporium fusiforme]